MARLGLGAGFGGVQQPGRWDRRGPVFGPEPADASIELHGNPPFVPPAGGFPPGTQTYGGLPLQGTGYTAQLWGGPLATPGYDPVLQLCGTTTFRTGLAGGFVLRSTAAVPGVPFGMRASFEMRVWDNQDGAITEWNDVLADPTILRGTSGIFSPPAVLGGDVFIPLFLQGLQSFNIHTVPEPGLGWLALAGLVAAWTVRRVMGRTRGSASLPG